MSRVQPRTVREEIRPGEVPLWAHPGWERDFPWLLQGTTGRGDSPDPWDMALFGDGRSRPALERWRALLHRTGATAAVHARQVHGPTVLLHGERAPGIHLSPDCDGHATRAPGVLMAVSVADCVPVLLVDPVRRAVAALHGGWRGVAAGVVERGIAVLAERLASRPADLHLHLGPAICGDCYEVGPEVHEALGLEAPPGPTPVDLRDVVALRAENAGLSPERITVSEHCTLCGDSPFFSHRGGSPERQVAVLGLA